MLGIHRYFYNRTINVINNYDKIKGISYYYINHKDEKSKIIINIPKDKNIWNFNYLRSILKINKHNWMSEVYLPSHEIDGTINKTDSKVFRHKRK